MVSFERKYKENKKVFHDCRAVQNDDIPQLKKICLEDTSNSRFFNDLSSAIKV